MPIGRSHLLGERLKQLFFTSKGFAKQLVVQVSCLTFTWLNLRKMNPVAHPPILSGPFLVSNVHPTLKYGSSKKLSHIPIFGTFLSKDDDFPAFFFWMGYVDMLVSYEGFFAFESCQLAPPIFVRIFWSSKKKTSPIRNPAK